MIDFNELISDESLAAYIDGVANSFESMQINVALSSSDKISEAYDIAKSALEIEDFSDFINIEKENICIAEFIEKFNNNKIK